jgi:hypothetical protein
MLAKLSLLALLGLPLFGRNPEVHDIGRWRLDAHRDAFTGQTLCTLTRGGTGPGGIEYTHHALVLHLSPKTDTSAALYRLDQGPVYAVKTDQADLAKLGFPLHADDLDNPSAGLVRIPIARVVGARVVSVDYSVGRRVVVFKIDGLAAALDAAAAAGCVG